LANKHESKILQNLQLTCCLPHFTQNKGCEPETETEKVELKDRAERHDLKSRFLLFILIFFFSLLLGGKRMTKAVILSHTFLLD
jgi:hypothetical protein